MIFRIGKKKKENPSIEELKQAQKLFKLYGKYEPKIDMIEIRYNKNGTIDIEDTETKQVLKITPKPKGDEGKYLV